jgi:hypothetical protein
VLVVLLATVWFTVAIYVWVRYRHLFREVILRRPVLTFESDDWGPGPVEDGIRLRELAACAASYHDSRNRPATVTLGVVLAVAETPLEINHVEGYRRVTLDSERCSPVREAMLDGAEQGVFFLNCMGRSTIGLQPCWPLLLRSTRLHVGYPRAGFRELNRCLLTCRAAGSMPLHCLLSPWRTRQSR